MSQLTFASPFSRPVIAMMTDFGLRDGTVGVMKGVIAGITPAAHIVDITHEIEAQNVPSGAWILASAYRYFPKGTVYLCVVDPGVGSTRRAISMHAGDWFFVGPDNGLFSYIIVEQAVHEAVVLDNPAYHLAQVSSTFHGRDIFAPVAAHLAGGVALHELGTAVDIATLQRNEIKLPVRSGLRIDGHILHIDHFGNLITSIPLTMVPELFASSRVQIIFPATNAKVDRRRRFFAEGAADGRPFIYGDSSGYVAIAVRDGNAAGLLGAVLGTSIIVELHNGGSPT